MTKLSRLALVVLMTMLVIALTVPAQANQCRPVKVALDTPCFQSQMAPFAGSPMFKVETEVTDMGGGMMDVGFYFVPKCLNDPVPCRIATQYVGGTVDCNTGAAICD
jgi:hypothetical protein